MAFQLLYTEPALEDLNEILEWSWVAFPEDTEKFANDLLDSAENLKQFPYEGTALYGFQGVRRLVQPPINIYYRLLVDQLNRNSPLPPRKSKSSPILDGSAANPL